MVTSVLASDVVEAPEGGGVAPTRPQRCDYNQPHVHAMKDRALKRHLST
jgi:hypothetical protein